MNNASEIIKKPWTTGEEETLYSLASTHSNKELAEILGRTEKSIAKAKEARRISGRRHWSQDRPNRHIKLDVEASYIHLKDLISELECKMKELEVKLNQLGI